MHILIAPNAFKNSLTAKQAAEAIKKGLQESALDCICECFPIGDGGDGTGELLVEKCNGLHIETTAGDPFGRKINAGYGLIDNGMTAIIEMADASGLRLLHPAELNPLLATSYGTGEMIVDALGKGVTKIIIGMGGAATVDGGTGILAALGMRFLNEEGHELTGMPGSLVHLHSVDMSGLDNRVANCEIIVLCDVDNPLLGSSGAAAVFGPQKGAGKKEVQQLEEALARLKDVLLAQTGKDISQLSYGGTAGGAAAGVCAVLNAQLVNGADHFLTITNFANSLASADLVITGEGSIDEQTLQGKGPYSVAAMAKNKGIPVIGLAGKIPTERNEALARYFDLLLSINEPGADAATAIKNSADNLRLTGCHLGDSLSLHATL